MAIPGWLHLVVALLSGSPTAICRCYPSGSNPIRYRTMVGNVMGVCRELAMFHGTYTGQLGVACLRAYLPPTLVTLRPSPSCLQSRQGVQDSQSLGTMRYALHHRLHMQRPSAACP